MKTTFRTLLLLIFGLSAISLSAQNRDLNNYRFPDQRGIDIFETKKDTATTFEKIQVRVGGSSTLQFQAVNHENCHVGPRTGVHTNAIKGT